jgi:hypothetical protein
VDVDVLIVGARVAGSVWRRSLARPASGCSSSIAFHETVEIGRNLNAMRG